MDPRTATAVSRLDGHGIPIFSLMTGCRAEAPSSAHSALASIRPTTSMAEGLCMAMAFTVAVVGSMVALASVAARVIAQQPSQEGAFTVVAVAAVTGK